MSRYPRPDDEWRQGKDGGGGSYSINQTASHPLKRDPQTALQESGALEVPEVSEEVRKRSEEFKAQGNVYFGKKDFQRALVAYTTAITMAPNSSLYSNRSATQLQLNRANEALKDAETSVMLDPVWSKAYRRKGNVLETQGRFEDAILAYVEARNLDEDERVQESLKKTIEALMKRIREQELSRRQANMQSLSADLKAAAIIFREVETRSLRGEIPGSWPPVGSCFRRLWLADLQWAEALRLLSHFKKNEMPEMGRGAYGISGPLQTLAELTSAALEDPRVISLMGEDLHQLQLCYSLEQQQRDAVGPKMSIKQTIAEYQRRLDSGISWDKVRPAMQLSIRGSLMNGIVKNMIDPDTKPAHGEITSVDHLKRACGLLEEARWVFANVPGGTRGRTLELTFLRACKALLGNFLIKQYNTVQPPSLAILNEIKAIGDWLIASCELDPLPEGSIPPHDTLENDKFWSLYLPYWRFPMAQGHLFHAHTALQLGLNWNMVSLDAADGRHGPIAGGVKDLRTAAEEYTRAAAWLPEDDPDFANSLWYGIFAMVRRGCYYVQDLILLRSLCEASQRLWSPYFGNDYIPADHPGITACREALAQSDGMVPESICSPLVIWPNGVAIDGELLGEVMMPWISKTVHGIGKQEGGGMLLLGRVFREEWAKRVRIGEPHESVERLWGLLDGPTKMKWQKVLKVDDETAARSRY